MLWLGGEFTMDIFLMLIVIFLTLFLTFLVLCYALLVLRRMVQKLDSLLRESKSLIEDMSKTQKSNLENEKGKNPILVILSKVQDNKGETMTNEQVKEVDKTIH